MYGEDAEDDELARDMAAAQRKMQGAREKKRLKVRHKTQMDRLKTATPDEKKDLKTRQDAESKSNAIAIKRDIENIRRTEGLWDNIRKKKERIKKGSGEKMRKPGEKGAPTPAQIQRAQEDFELNEKRAKQAVAGGKVQKLVTAHGLKFKGKVYKEIDMELVKIDNSTQTVTFNIIHPKEIFGNEVKLSFKVLKRGPFMATDTSKINEDFELNEKIEGLVKKSEKSGIAYGILKKVYSRGMAAWRTGHRPGTTPQQWAFARVNSFITGGGARKSDADLWRQHKGK